MHPKERSMRAPENSNQNQQEKEPERVLPFASFAAGPIDTEDASCMPFAADHASYQLELREQSGRSQHECKRMQHFELARRHPADLWLWYTVSQDKPLLVPKPKLPNVFSRHGHVKSSHCGVQKRRRLAPRAVFVTRLWKEPY